MLTINCYTHTLSLSHTHNHHILLIYFCLTYFIDLFYKATYTTITADLQSDLKWNADGVKLFGQIPSEPQHALFMFFIHLITSHVMSRRVWVCSVQRLATFHCTDEDKWTENIDFHYDPIRRGLIQCNESGILTSEISLLCVKKKSHAMSISPPTEDEVFSHFSETAMSHSSHPLCFLCSRFRWWQPKGEQPIHQQHRQWQRHAVRWQKHGPLRGKHTKRSWLPLHSSPADLRDCHMWQSGRKGLSAQSWTCRTK